MKKYRSDVKNPKVVKLLFLGCLFLLGAVIYGQITGDRFPTYSDIVIAPLIAVGLYGILWVFAVLMPITVKPETIKCYTAQGRYKEISWAQIESVTLMKLYGLPYAYLESESLSSPITLPLYLENMQDFKETIYKYAGLHNPLSEFLQSET